MDAAIALKRRVVRFTEPLRAELVEHELDAGRLEPRQMLVETDYSVVSAGTELSVYRGIEAWCRPPCDVGYGSVGRVVRAGSAAAFAPGARVFTYGNHADLNIVDHAFPVPEDVEGRIAPLVARMGQVAFTAVRLAAPSLGDVVAVTGLGLVGILAAQLLKLSGCTVIGIDLSPRRRALARACGIDHALDPREGDLAEAVGSLTGKELCRTVVEATGVPGMVATATGLAGYDGQVILLGTPRGEFVGNATEMLRDVHHAHRHVTLRGAHEWIYPMQPSKGCPYSLERNVRDLFALARQGRLQLDALISHCLPPERCQEVYTRLLERSDDHVGVIFDWTARRG